MKKQKNLHWTTEQDAFLIANYPTKGKMFCASALDIGEASVRWRASRLGLRLDRSSGFVKDFQARSAASKIGKKRPEQALVMKRLHAEGKLKKTEEQKIAIGKRMKQQWKDNPHPKGMLGKKHSRETLVALSAISKDRAANMTDEQTSKKTRKMINTKMERGNLINQRQKQTWKADWHEIGGKRRYYRSRWESNYARYLEFLKSQGKIKDWFHEPKVFWFEGIKRGCVSYLPDFLVIENDGSEAYHEVKGWMDDRSKTKIKRMAKYFPGVKLVVVDSKAYKVLSKTAASVVPEWQ